MTEDEMKDLKGKINTMTADVDFLNAQEGYRGTSYESVFLLSASDVGRILRTFKIKKNVEVTDNGKDNF